MKTIKRVLLGLALAFVCVITLASCSKVSQSYADKINEAASNKEYVTVADAKDALGDECFQLDFVAFGVLYAVKGFNNTMTPEEVEAKYKEGDENTKYQAIVIGYVGSNCVKAIYVEGSEAEIEAQITSMKA